MHPEPSRMHENFLGHFRFEHGIIQQNRWNSTKPVEFNKTGGIQQKNGEVKKCCREIYYACRIQWSYKTYLLEVI